MAPSYLEHSNATYGPLPDGPYLGSELFISRLIPRNTSDGPEALTSAMLEAMDLDAAADWQFGCMGFNVNTSHIEHPDNGVAPFCRDRRVPE